MTPDEFRSTLHAPSPIPDDRFRAVIEHGIDTGLITVDDCVREFEVSRSAVGRWRDGYTAPHPLLRTLVFAAIAKRLE